MVTGSLRMVIVDLFNLNPIPIDILRYKGKTSGKTTGVHQIGTHIWQIGLKNLSEKKEKIISTIRGNFIPFNKSSF